MPSNHVIFCHSLLLLPQSLPYSWSLALRIKWPKRWRFHFNRNQFKCINWKGINKCVFVYTQNDCLCRKVNGTYKRSFVINKFSMFQDIRILFESALDCKIKPVSPKGNQSWIFIGRTDAEAEASTLWPADGKSWFMGKDPYVGRDWGKRRMGGQRMRRFDSIIHSMDMNLNTLQEKAGTQSLVCYSPWGCEELDTS